MARTATAEGFQFLVSELQADKSVAYAALREKAEKRGLTVYPVMFGRAKAMLGLVKSAKRGEGKFAQASAEKKRVAASRTDRGEGSKSERIRELLGSGMSAGDIAKKVGCSVNLVYVVKSARKAGRRARPPVGRGPARAKVSGINGALGGIVAALREGERERERLRRALEQIRAIIDGVA